MTDPTLNPNPIRNTDYTMDAGTGFNKQAEPIQLERTPEDNQQPMNMETNQNEAVPPWRTSVRADKYQFGTQTLLNWRFPDIQDLLATGKEQTLRQSAASTLDFNKRQAAIHYTGWQDPMLAEQLMSPQFPESVLEYLYAGEFVDNDKYLLTDSSSNPIKSATRDFPEEIRGIKIIATNHLANRESVRRELEDVQDQAQSQSTLGWLADQSKSLVPFWTELDVRKALEAWDPELRGFAIGDAIKRWQQMDNAEFQPKFHAMIQEVAKHNPSLAVDIASKFLSYGWSDTDLENLFGAVDITAVKPAVGGILAVRSFMMARQGIKELLKTAASGAAEARPVKLVADDATGNVGKAAIDKAAIEWDASGKPSVNPAQADLDALPNAIKTGEEDIKKSPGRFGQEIINRIVESSTSFRTNLTNIISNLQRVQRIPGPLATVKGMQAIKDEIARDYPGLRNNIMNIDIIHRPVPNVYTAETYLGRPAGLTQGPVEMFENPEEAYHFALNSGLIGSEDFKYSLGQQGHGFYIKLTKPINETTDTIRDLLMSTTVSQPPQSWANTFLHWIRTPEDTLSEDHRIARKVASYAPGAFEKVARDAAADIRKLRGFNIKGTAARKRWDEWKRVIEAAREETDKMGLKGVTFDTPPELDEFYLKTLSRLPDAQETAAYFAFKRVNDFDHALRNLAIFRNKMRVGTQSHSFTIFNESGDPFKSPAFDGVIRRFLPKTDSSILMAERISVPQAPPEERAKWAEVKPHMQELKDDGEKWLKAAAGHAESGTYSRAKSNLASVGRRISKIARNPNLKGEEDVKKLWSQYKDTTTALKNLIEFEPRPGVVRATNVAGRGLPGDERAPPVSMVFDTKNKMTELTNSLRQFLADRERMLGEDANQNIQNTATMNSTLRKKVEDGLIKGEYKLIEIYDPETRPLAGFGNIGENRIRYVLVKNVESKEISWNQLPRRGGGHFDYDYEHFIKQGKVRWDTTLQRHIYEGDNTVMPMASHPQAVELTRRLEEARLFYKDKDFKAAEDYVKRYLPMSWREFDSWFKPTRDPNGKLIGPRLDPNERFHVVGEGKSIIDSHKLSDDPRFNGRLIDGTKSGSLARQYQVQYTGQRDAWDVYTAKDIGSQGNPIFQMMPAEKVDPITSMNRAFKRISDSTWGDDYKVSAIEHWLQQARPYLKADASEVSAAPFWVFNNAQFLAGADKTVVSRLKGDRYKIQQFAGLANSYDNFMRAAAQRAADSAYARFGRKGEQIVPSWLLSRTKDPWTFTRSAVFDMKMGFFNIAQFMVHFMTYVNVMGIAGPVRASQGLTGAVLYGWARHTLDPNILNHLDGIATKMGWEKGEWLEAYHGYNSTGANIEHGEHAMRDDQMSTQLIRSGTKEFLHAGQMFFRGGVKTLRAGAYFTAHKEFRVANPVSKIGKLGPPEMGRITDRMDLLAHNMTRASSSILHTGVMSSIMQFGTYFLRLAEMSLGGRLTYAEKARLFFTNALVYGFPTATGLTGIPFSEGIRQYAMDHGYVPGDKLSILMEGAPAAIGAFLNGGQYYNWGSRYGPDGISAIGKIVYGDTNFWNGIGAAPGTIYNMWKHTNGFVFNMVSAMRGDGESSLSPALDEFSTTLREISSYNNAWGFVTALKYGEYFTKSGRQLGGNITPFGAAFTLGSGLTPIERSDAYIKQHSMQQEKELEQYAHNQFVELYRKGLRAGQDNNPDQAQEYFRKAFTFMPLIREEDRTKALSAAIHSNEDLLSNTGIDWQRYIKYPNPQHREEDADTYRKIQDIEEQKNGR